MKLNIQNQYGYALFIVMGLMVLSTIGVMATYKAVSNYDDKSGSSFKVRDAKEVAEAGTRSVESYLRDNSLDAVGILQQMYIEKMDENLEVIPVKVPMGALKGTSSWYDIYFTDVTWDSTYLFVTAQIIGTGVHGGENQFAQSTLYKVGGLKVYDLGYTKMEVSGNTPVVVTNCSPDLALYLGGNQAANITKNIFVDGGFYTTNLNQSGTKFIHVRNGFLMGNGPGTTEIKKGWGFNVKGGDFFSAKKISYNPEFQAGYANNWALSGNAEFAKDFIQVGWAGFVRNTTIAGDLTLSDWKVEITAGPGGVRTIDVAGDLVIHDNWTKSSNSRLIINVGGNVIIKGILTLLSNDRINLLNKDSIANLGGSSLPAQVTCRGATCQVADMITDVNDLPASWATNIVSVSAEKGISRVTYRKTNDIGVLDDFYSYGMTWAEMYDSAKVAGVVTGNRPAKISVSQMNLMSSDVAFVEKFGFRGFLIFDLDRETGLVSSLYDASGQSATLTGKWAFKNLGKQVNYVGSCFPESASSARIFWHNKSSAFHLNICNGNGDAFKDYYGFVYHDAAANSDNLFSGSSRVYGAVYTNGGNNNAFTGSGTDSIFSRQDVMADISPIGLVKLNSQGDTVANCLTGQVMGEDAPENEGEAVETYKLVAKVLEAKVSQLSVKRVGNVQTMKIDKLMEGMDTGKADIKVTPYVGFSHNRMTMSNDLDKRYADLEDLMEKTNFKAFYQFKGDKNGNKCTATWGEEADDFDGLENTTLEIPYTVNCGTGSRPVTRNFILTIGDGLATSSVVSSVVDASSSSVAASSVALSSIAASSSVTATINLCEGIPNWVNRNYNWTGTKEYAVYQDKLYSHINWVNNTTPNLNSGWSFELNCIIAASSANVPSSSSAEIIETFQITTPIENESFIKGELVTFLWNSNSAFGVDIYVRNITTNVGAWELIKSNAANPGSFSYNINRSGKLEYKLYLTNPVSTEDRVIIEVQEPVSSSVPASSTPLSSVPASSTPLSSVPASSTPLSSVAASSSAAVDPCIGIPTHTTSRNWSTNSLSQKSGKLYKCNQGSYCRWNGPGTSFWTFQTNCGIPIEGEDSVCDSEAVYVHGAAKVNGKKYVHSGKLYQAKNNPGAWEKPQGQTSWFWKFLQSCS